MSEKNTGGPAFPTVDNWRVDSGMALRDYFAAAALHASLSSGEHADAKYAAKFAYAYADAMLKARAE